MEAEDWKYVQNQFLAVTEDNWSLMTEIILDTYPKLLAVAAEDPSFDIVVDIVEPARTAWLAGDAALANGEASYALATDLFENKMATLQTKPEPETNALGVQWETIVIGAVAVGGPTYNYLLPTGRTGWSSGSYAARLEYVEQFATRLGQQAGKPTLLALAPTVAAWHTAAETLREAQTTREGELTTARTAMDPLRIDLCQTLHGMIGFGLFKWHKTPIRCASLVELALLREDQQELPGIPAGTVWDPAARTLSTTALPAHATRLEAWRLGPGGAPERLLIGDPGALALIIPADITFFSGETYNLWLQGRNSRGTSAPGPQQVWTAP